MMAKERITIEQKSWPQTEGTGDIREPPIGRTHYDDDDNRQTISFAYRYGVRPQPA